MSFDPYIVLARTLEREEALYKSLNSLLEAIDSSPIGPAVRLLPQWQLDDITATVESSDEERAAFYEYLEALPEDLEDE